MKTVAQSVHDGLGPPSRAEPNGKVANLEQWCRDRFRRRPGRAEEWRWHAIALRNDRSTVAHGLFHRALRASPSRLLESTVRKSRPLGSSTSDGRIKIACCP